MAFLPALFVNDGLSFSEHILPFTGTSDDFQIVHGFALNSLVLGEVNWGGTGGVGDDSVDSFAFVWMGIFEKRHAQELMRSDELC